METLLNILNYSYVVITVTAIFISLHALYTKTKDLKNNKVKEVRFLDIPVILALFVVATLDLTRLKAGEQVTLSQLLFFLTSTILFIYYLVLIVKSKVTRNKQT